MNALNIASSKSSTSCLQIYTYSQAPHVQSFINKPSCQLDTISRKREMNKKVQRECKTQLREAKVQFEAICSGDTRYTKPTLGNILVRHRNIGIDIRLLQMSFSRQTTEKPKHVEGNLETSIYAPISWTCLPAARGWSQSRLTLRGGVHPGQFGSQSQVWHVVTFTNSDSIKVCQSERTDKLISDSKMPCLVYILVKILCKKKVMCCVHVKQKMATYRYWIFKPDVRFYIGICLRNLVLFTLYQGVPKKKQKKLDGEPQTKCKHLLSCSVTMLK